MNTNLNNYLKKIVEEGLDKNYWFMTKQTLTDFYLIYIIAKVVETYKSNKKPNENFGMYYSRFFSEDPFLKRNYPKQSGSDNTYRNAIISEFVGLFQRENAGYDSGIVTPAYHILSKYINSYEDMEKYRFIMERQIEKLCLNINDKTQNFNDLSKVKIFPVMFLYKILYELFKRTGDSTLYYDEFVVFLVRARKYSDWENTLELLMTFRSEILDEESKSYYKKIANDVTATNIRFDALFGSLSNIEYSKKQDRNYYKIKDSFESKRYIENAIEIFESSKFSRDLPISDLQEFLKSDKYFIGNLETMYQVSKLDSLKTESKVESPRITGGTNIILYGVPGAGKSYTIDHEYKDKDTIMRRVVFHPDYTYSDFVGQILPKAIDGNISYEFVPGPFTRIVNDAYHNPMTKYTLVIEEVNRGNAPAIFGDIFQLLDRDEKGTSVYGINNSDIAKVVYGDEGHEVRIPSNLSIICTMNTSDQNVFTLDTAFQRRWNMRLIENKFNKDIEEEKIFAEKVILDTTITWETFWNVVNEQILEKNQNFTSSEDKRLGIHFVTYEDLNCCKDDSIDLIRRFPEKVIKYLWDDAFKFCREEIFKAEFNSLEKLISEYLKEEGIDRFNIFNDNIKDAFKENNK